MKDPALRLSIAVYDAFTSFLEDSSLLALQLILNDMSLQPLPVPSKMHTTSFQITLNELSTLLSPRVSLYLILRRQNKLVAITFVPYLAQESQRTFFMENRHKVLQLLGENHFSQSLICKEIGEVVDARSWTERDEAEPPLKISARHTGNTETCDSCENCTLQEIGYRRNVCRLCDRRMMNKIDSDALDAFASLEDPGIVVQLSVTTTMETLGLNFSKPQTPPELVSELLSKSSPSFTFYRHPGTSMLYLIYHSPDDATVQQRMKHTIAIPGLLVHAEDAGIRVDRKIEIHDPDDLVFEEAKDERVGRFRSMYRRDEFNGTELTYEGMERDKALLDAL